MKKFEITVDDVYMLLETSKMTLQRFEGRYKSWDQDLERVKELQKKFFETDWDEDTVFYLIEK